MLLLQLADSALPAGAFAHSLGLEALRALGELRDERDLALRLGELAWHTAYAVVPFLGAAHGGDPIAADRAADAFLTGHVANRASRAQGRAFLLVAEAMFDAPPPPLPCAHLPVALGAVLAIAGVPLDDARRLAMFGAVRSACSAAVRLGALGPLRAQRLLLDVAPTTEHALTATRALRPEDARSIAPLVDLAQAAHDQLYARLFQS
jgi:urease accessory protein